MTENLTQIEHLLLLFEERDQLLQLTTQQIFEILRPTVLEALCELFELPFDEVEWGDVEYTEGVVVIVCAVWFSPVTSSEFLKEIFKDDEVTVQHSKFIRIGFPIAHSFKPKQEIIDFLMAQPPFTTAKSFVVEPPKKIKDNSTRFDISDLTDEQILQLKIYQHHDTGAKH